MVTAFSVLLLAALFASPIIQPARAACTGTPVMLTVNVYRSLGQVQWNGVNYNNGNLISAYAGCSYTVTGVNFVQESTQGHNFQAWLSNAGSFANPNYYTTTFTPSASGKLVLVLYGYPINTGAPGTYPDWGGYVVSGSSVYVVYGTITLPTTVSWVQVSTWKPDNLVSLWLGLGGWSPSGNHYTWQAGVDIDITQGGSLTFRAWYEDLPLGSVSAPSWFSSAIRLGDWINVKVQYWTSNTTGMIWMQDTSQGYVTWKYVYSSLPYPPDGITAEWMSEDPECYVSGAWRDPCYVIPQVSDIQVSSASSSVSANLVAPLEAWIEIEPWCYWEQRLTPTSVGGSGLNQFSLHYSTRATYVC